MVALKATNVFYRRDRSSIISDLISFFTFISESFVLSGKNSRGNVFEWCYDVHKNNIAIETVTNPKGAPGGAYRVARGGGYDYEVCYNSVCFRGQLFPSELNDNCGFRVVRNAN